MLMAQWKEKIHAVMKEKQMDIKDLHRTVGVDQRILQMLMESDNNDTETDEALNTVLKFAEEETKPDMLRFKQPKVIAVWAHKGGTGKTTISSNLAYELARRGYNVLAVDTDDQCDMTSVLYPEYVSETENDFYDAFTMRDDFVGDEDTSYIRHTEYENLDMVPGSARTTGIENSLAQADDAILKKLFAKCLQTIMKENFYDFIVIDMEKSAGKLNKAILCQTDYVISPIECAQFSSKSIVNIMIQIENVKELNGKLKWLGIVLNKVDNRRKNSIQANREQIEEICPGMKFESYINTDNNFDNSQANFRPIGYFAKSSHGNKKFVEFVDEVIEKIGKENA